MDFDLYLRFALALILVLGLIALLAWMLRRFGMGMKMTKGRRLASPKCRCSARVTR